MSDMPACSGLGCYSLCNLVKATQLLLRKFELMYIYINDFHLFCLKAKFHSYLY
ncbi:hypothetical protein HanRHA438_Chr03g0106541 [Helianthus annuus]|uniref:Uncharacterized protein n=1 Tax=Helianthus annuus TaxID=4232 RepID=A0A9K3NV83_HELAN|nr:hypothetical protein HanXRQr2_Chr03g0095461 [Helianthus annuus]KAJ0934361.1 hypothetical protein HanRHA438_Chr03g0106541 [Helianthus annuus]KAJ0942447.1 hypothetical protein HanPSC8_Chr03g0092051 [Helianthus annuus]